MRVNAILQEKAESLANQLRTEYPSQLFVTARADFSRRDSTRALVPNILQREDVAEKHKTISILVANAGLARRIRDINEIDEEAWDDVLEVNSRSQFVIVKACLTGMRGQGWGRVILIGSISSRGGGINGCHYAASKGALRFVLNNLVGIQCTGSLLNGTEAQWA